MKALYLLLALPLFSPTKAEAQDLSDYRWKSRLVLVFTPTPEDPLFVRQLALLQSQQEGFAERDVVILLITPKGKSEPTDSFLDRKTSQRLYDRFNVRPDQLELILVGLDGGEKLRRQNQLTAPEVFFSTIDRMPMRRQQLRRKERTGGRK